jgi:hypothetical protein
MYNHKEYQKEYQKKWYKKNKEKRSKQIKEYYLKNKERLLKINKENRKKNDYDRLYYLKNKEKKQKYKKEYYLKNKKYIIKKVSSYILNKRKNNINYNLLCSLRTRLNHALKGNSKSKKTLELLGVKNIEFLKKYLENKFKPGMNWKKRHLIHIDHIIPCSSFDLTNPKQQAKCFHYTNLQPLWAKENLIKSNKLLKF